jgi:hypothetical protein
MVYSRSGLNRNVFYTVFSYRILYPYGRSVSKSAFFVLINHSRKMLINTGVIENQGDLESLLAIAGYGFGELNYVINMTSRPEHIGLNSIIQYRNKKALFFALPSEIPYIEDTVLQHEERYVPGFYRLVAGNTIGVDRLKDGLKFDLGEENVVTVVHDDKFYLYLDKSGISVYPGDISIPAFNDGKVPGICIV